MYNKSFKYLIRISWRNLWRNRRRTLITAASIFFAVFFSIIMRSFQIGTYDHMIHQIIESYSGYIQIQHRDFADDPSIDNAFLPEKGFIQSIQNQPNVRIAAPRIESFGLASNGIQTKGVLITGIDLTKERALSNPEEKLVRYRISDLALERLKKQVKLSSQQWAYLHAINHQSFTQEQVLREMLQTNQFGESAIEEVFKTAYIPSKHLNADDSGALISDRLSQFLKLNVGDTLVLMGQGYHGASAAHLFPVKGIIQMPSIELDNKLVVLPIEKAGEFFSLEGRITSININLNRTRLLEKTKDQLSTMSLGKTFVVRDWMEVSPTLKQQIEGDSKSGLILIGILYLIVFFGIYGTVQMMLSERRREFGMMVAIGMKQHLLAKMLVLEMAFMGFIGILSGALAAIPLLLLGHDHPIRMTGNLAKMYQDYGFDPVLPLALFDAYFFTQILVVLLMVVVASLLPIRKILNINPVKSIHG